MPTLWKIPTEKCQNNNLISTEIESMGDSIEVIDKLSTIPRITQQFTLQNQISLLWETQNILISFKDEPEFGKNEVFSLKIDKVLFERDFYKLYVQLFENLGCILLLDKEFIEPRRFKRMI